MAGSPSFGRNGFGPTVKLFRFACTTVPTSRKIEKWVVEPRTQPGVVAVAACLAHEPATPGRTCRVALGSSTAAALTAEGLAHTCAPSTDAEDVLATLVRACPGHAPARAPNPERTR